MSEHPGALTSSQPLHEDNPSVTVVVPTKNAARTLAACLQSLRSQTYPCRIVVVDNNSTDATVQIAEELADLVLHWGPERSAQRNYGARSCPADVVGFIDADMVLEPAVVQEAVEALEKGAGSVIVPEKTVGTGFWAQVRAFERSFYVGSDAIEAARFFRWHVFEGAGGFDELLTGPEDWDLTESARTFAPVARTRATTLHDEGTLGYFEACKKKAYYAEGLRRYVAKRGAHALVQASRRPWLHQPRILLNQHGIGLIALKIGEAAALVLALATHSLSATARLSLSRCASTPNGSPWLRRSRRLLKGAAWCTKAAPTLYHSARTFARLAIGFAAPRLGTEVSFHFKSGILLVAPAGDYAWWAISEVVIDDQYRLDELARELNGSTRRVIDIGANIGAFTVTLAKLVPGAQFVALEPSSKSVSYLRRNVIANAIAERVSVVQAAVAGKAGRQVLTGGGLTATLSALPSACGEEVDVMGFEDVMRNISGSADLVKMDCEGSEYDIVEHTSLATLRRVHRLLLEYHPAPRDRVDGLFTRLSEAGLMERWRRTDPAAQLGVAYLTQTSS